MMDTVVRTGPDASKQGMDAAGSITSPAVNGEPAFSGVRSEVGSLPSVADVSRTSCLASFVAKAYLVPGSDRVRFDLWKPSLEKRIGIRFETGKMYLLKGTISGIGQFESRHIARANQHVYVFPRSG